MKKATLIVLLISLTTSQDSSQDPNTLLGLQIIKKPKGKKCYKIPKIGNPIKLLKASIDALNSQLAENSNSTIRLIYQKRRNKKYTYVFKIKNYEQTDYIGIVYRDRFNDGTILHQIMSVELNMVNRALGLNVYDNYGIDCEDFKCIWNDNCQDNDYCENCPFCEGCQGSGVCRDCRNCYECPQCPRCYYLRKNNNNNGDYYGDNNNNNNGDYYNNNDPFDNYNGSDDYTYNDNNYVDNGNYDFKNSFLNNNNWGILGAAPDLSEKESDDDKKDDDDSKDNK